MEKKLPPSGAALPPSASVAGKATVEGLHRLLDRIIALEPEVTPRLAQLAHAVHLPGEGKAVTMVFDLARTLKGLPLGFLPQAELSDAFELAGKVEGALKLGWEKVKVTASDEEARQAVRDLAATVEKELSGAYARVAPFLGLMKK